MKKQRFHGVFTKEQVSKNVEGILQFAEETPDLINNKYKVDGKVVPSKIEKHIRNALAWLPGFGKPSKNIPDPAVRRLVETLYDLNASDENQKIVQIYRGGAMDIGKLLELFIAKKGISCGLFFCGEVVSKTDFVIKLPDGTWDKIQIKNSKKTENSSSAQIRTGTDVKVWHRRSSTNNATFWEEFPVTDLFLCSNDTEKDFIKKFQDRVNHVRERKLSCGNI